MTMRAAPWGFAAVATLTCGAVLCLGYPPRLSAQDAPVKGKDSGDKSALAQDIDDILNVKALKKAKVSVHVRDLRTGEVLYDRHGHDRLNPASNTKVLTAAAVLDKHGPDFTFKTEIWGGVQKGAELSGNVVLKGNGDPFLLWGHLLEMAARLRAKGIKRVTGDLVVDDTAYDDKFLPPQFDQKHEDATYRATVSAVSVEFSTVTVIIAPGKVGSKPKVTFDPPGDYALIVNNATTVATKKEASKKPLTLASQKDGDGTKMVVGGLTWTGGGATVRKRVHNPSLYAGHVMKAAFSMVGIKVKGKVRRGARSKKEKNVYARHVSYTLPYMVAAMAKWSNNFMAEMLFKSLDLGDKAATWGGAQNKMRAFLTEAGLKEGSYTVKNGSGLYDANELGAAQFTKVLTYIAQRRDIRPEFEASLAIAGVDGTLKRRMTKGPALKIVRGKTGTLNGVSTLTGYVDTKKAGKIGFSILFNRTRGGAWAFRKIQDEIAAAIVRRTKGR